MLNMFGGSRLMSVSINVPLADEKRFQSFSAISISAARLSIP